MSQENQLLYHWKSCLFFVANYLLINYNSIIFKGDQKFITHHNNFHKFHQSKNLAFSFLLKEKRTNVLDFHMPMSQEIIIHGIDNYILKDKLLKKLEIKNNYDQIISKQSIDNLVNKIKASGFFTHIDISNQFLNNHQVIHITLNLNPILKSIRIHDFQKKLIPSKYIMTLFNKDIGYPINFVEVNKNIDLIQEWYHARGYKWADVNISSLNNIKGYIIINISEGVITKIEITNYNDPSYLIRSLPTSLFLETLKIQPYTVLNTKKIDKGIFKLKQKKVIAHCNYEIISNFNNQLRVYLIVGLLDDRYTYLFSKNVSITSSLLESIDFLFQSSLNHLFYNNVELDLFNTIYRAASASRYNYNFANSIYFKMFDYDNHALQLLKPIKCKIWPYINEWYLTQLIFIAGDTFGFRHYIRNVGISNSSYLIDMRFPITGPYLNLRYDQPWISIYNQILSNINMHLYKDNYIFHKNSIPILLEQLNDYAFYHKNFILSETGLSLTCKHDLNTSIYLVEYLSLKQIVSKYLLLHNSTIWHDLKSIINSSLNPYYSYFKQIWVNNIQEFFQLDMKIISTHANYFFKSCETIFEISHFIPKKINNIFYRLPITLNYGNKIRVKINAQYNFINNLINFESELLTFIGRLESLPYSEHFFSIGPDIVRGYIEKVFPFPLRFGKVKLEYHIQFAKYHSVFIFLDYAKNMKILNGLTNYQVLFSRYYLYKLNDFNFRLGYGIGLQIQTPLKQIPPLRIEYGYNIHNGNCLHLRLDKQ